jgi:protein TonB
MKHKTTLLIALCSIFSFAAAAQDTAKDTSEVRTYVEHMPSPGFDLNKWLGKHMHYPTKALEDGIQGRVLCKFVVNETGAISDVTVVKSASRELDEEAVRVLSDMPNWTPGMQNGKAVKVYFMYPIKFAIADDKKGDKSLPR